MTSRDENRNYSSRLDAGFFALARNRIPRV